MTDLPSKQQVSPETLATYRNVIVPLGQFCGVGGKALLALLDHIADLQQFHDWAIPQITDLNRGFPAETTAERWKERAVEAEGILSHNMALANATTRRAMNERNDIIRKLRERHSAIEIADMVGLTRQRVHQILNESPDEGASETPPVHTYTCTSCFTDAGQPHRPGCRNIEIDARQVKTSCFVSQDRFENDNGSDA